MEESSDSTTKKRQLQDISTTDDATQNSRERKIKFRNYQPRDKSLLAKTIDGSHADSTTPANIANQQNQPTNTNKNKSESNDTNTIKYVPVKENIILKELENICKQQVGGEDSINIAPKKINWDLKNQVQDKIDRLKRRTQRAIVEILREKLARAQDSGDESD